MTSSTETELAYTPASALIERIRRRELSPVELTTHVLDRAERLQPTLFAFMTLDRDNALAAARAAEDALVRGDDLGPLHGLPVSVKDLEATAGLRTTSGSKFLEDYVPTVDGAVAGRLRQCRAGTAADAGDGRAEAAAAALIHCRFTVPDATVRRAAQPLRPQRRQRGKNA